MDINDDDVSYILIFIATNYLNTVTIPKSIYFAVYFKKVKYFKQFFKAAALFIIFTLKVFV